MRNILSETETDNILNEAYPIFNKVFTSAMNALNKFKEDEARKNFSMLEARTISEMMNRYLVHYANDYFQDHDLIRPVKRGGRFWLSVGGDLIISLKKLNKHFQPSNIVTKQSKSVTHQSDIAIFPDGTCYLTLGYIFNSTQTNVEGIYFVCNDSTGKKLWHYDISGSVHIDAIIPFTFEEEEELSQPLQNLLSLKKAPLQKTNDAG